MLVNKRIEFRRIGILVLLLITVGFVLICPKAFATTLERECNDNIETANHILVDKWYSGSISDTGDKDLYRFEIDDSSYVEIIFGSGNSEGELEFDKEFWEISLTDGEGNVITSKDFVANRDIIPRVELKPGTYCLVIEAAEYHESAYYYIYVKSMAADYCETESNDNITTATPITADEMYYGNISKSMDVDFYRFKTTCDGTVQMEIEQEGADYDAQLIKVSLMDANEKIYKSGYVNGEETETTTIKIGLPPGIYYIKVGAYSEKGCSDASYTITANFEKTTDWETEWNDSLETADEIVINKVYRGNVCYYTDKDYYKFKTSSTGTVEVEFAYDYEFEAFEVEEGEINLRDAKGNLCPCTYSGAIDSGRIQLTAKNLQSGTYYIAIEDWYNSFYTVKAKWTANGPTGLKATTKVSNGKPKVKWNAVKGADKYEVWRKIGSSGTWKKQYTTTGREYINTSAVAGQKYYYKVRAVFTDTNTVSEFSASDYVTCDLARPIGFKVSTKASSGKPDVSWNKVSGADKYEVWRKVGSSGTWKKQYTTKGTSYTNTSAVAGKVYYYKVKAVYEDNTIANSAFSAFDYVTCDLARPKITVSGTKNPGRIVISWSKVSGADRYYIYRATSKNGTYEYYDSTRSTSYTNSSVREGKYYYYKVKAVYDDRSAANSAYSNMDYAWVR